MLSKEDWQYIAFAVQDRFNRAKPRKGEPDVSTDFKEQEERIMTHLLALAYPRGQ